MEILKSECHNIWKLYVSRYRFCEFKTVVTSLSLHKNRKQFSDFHQRSRLSFEKIKCSNHACDGRDKYSSIRMWIEIDGMNEQENLQCHTQCHRNLEI